MSNFAKLSGIVFREEIRSSDPDAVRTVAGSSGFFSAEEVQVAVELMLETLARGSAVSGYHFLFAELAGKIAGYSCFGPVPCTKFSYDLYWIAVENDLRGSGLGRELLRQTEAIIQKRGGRRIYVETSSRPLYLPTRRFYQSCGYRVEAVLKQFYAPQDDKVIFLRVLP